MLDLEFDKVAWQENRLHC